MNVSKQKKMDECIMMGDSSCGWGILLWMVWMALADTAFFCLIFYVYNLKS